MRTRRTVAAIAGTSIVCLITAMSGVASAHAKGIKGDPQPELKPFKLAGSGAEGGTVAIESNGDLVAAYVTSSAGTSVTVCVIARAGHSCTYTHKFTPMNGDVVMGIPQVFAPSPDHIALVMGAGDVHGDLLFTSSDGGKTFGAGVLVGDEIAPTSAELVDNQIVGTDTDDPHGVGVTAISLFAPAPPSSFAVPSLTRGSVAIGSYKGGVLVAGDNASSGPTKVEYAPVANDAAFNTTGSYKSVGTFTGERVGGMSGNALLTVQTGGKEHFLLRFFNGTSFGSAHVVPGGGDSGPQWWYLDQDPGGVTHMFRSDAGTSPIYELNEYSTTSGTHWSGPHHLGGAISNFFAAGLDKTGSGLVLGIGPAKGYPILAPQTASFSLSKSSVKKGHKVTGKGKVSPKAKGRKVELQIEKKGRWYDVTSTHESASGAFSFTIKGSSVGAAKYRAVASDHAGFVEFAYSSARSLTVKK
jgi:hypothetical protein